MTAPNLRQEVADAFERLRLPLVEDGPGCWRAQLPAVAGRPVLELRVEAEAEGRVLALRATPAAAFAAALRPELLEAVNHWHQVQRWPRLYVSNDLGCPVVEADAHVVLADGSGSAGIGGTVATFVGGCLDFWDVFTVPVDERSALEGIARIVDRGWEE